MIIHHLPVAVTFAFFRSESTLVSSSSFNVLCKEFSYIAGFFKFWGAVQVIDPTHYEEAVMGGRMTVTLNANNDVCAIQKAGGEGVLQSVIMQCLRIACVKAGDITTKIKNAVRFF